MKSNALEGIKVADFSWVVAGPAITQNLASYGATVVKIESRQRPDLLRVTMPFKDSKAELNMSGFFAYYNANKYSLDLNLKDPKGMEVVKRLVLWADVVVESFAPGVMEKWNLGYEDLKKIKSDVIMLRTSNLGQTGPFARQPGLGTHLNAFAGFLHLVGWPDRPPSPPQLAYTDYISSKFAATILVAALGYRRRTGKGQLLDLSQLETAIHFITPVLLELLVNNREKRREGNSCPYAAPHGAYRCKGDDSWCVIAVFTDEDWKMFCKVLGNPPWTKNSKFATMRVRKENEEELNKFTEEWTINLSAEQVMSMMQASGVCAGVVKSPEDIYNDSQLRHRTFLKELNHKEMGFFPHLCQASILSKTPADLVRPAPCLGEHTQFVCRELLGMSDKEFIDFIS